MSTMTLYAPPTPSKRAKAERSWFVRLCWRIHDARLNRARDVFKQHVHLLPPELQRAAFELTSRTEPTLPFVR